MASLPFLLVAVATIIFIYKLVGSPRQNPAKPLPPGPRPLPLVGNLPHLGKVPHLTFAGIAKKYGPLFYLRIGFVHVVVVNSASAAVHILKTHDTNFLCRPINFAGKYLGYNRQDIVFSEGPRWRLLRKICAVNLFSKKAMDAFQSIRLEEVRLLISGLAKADSNPVNLGQQLSTCVANVTGRLIVGKRLFGDGSGRNDERSDAFKRKVEELVVVSGEFTIGDFVPALAWLDSIRLAARMMKIHEWFDAFMTAIVKEHEEATGQGDRPSDMLDILLSLKDNAAEGVKLSYVDINAVLVDLFVAGSDSTSSTVLWGMSEIIRSPDILARLRDEIDSAVGHDRLVTEHDLPKLTYLQAVVKENFRMHPIFPNGVPRRALESVEVNGYHIPKGSSVFLNLWAIARDPDVWSEPEIFRPERFLPDGEKANIDVKGNDLELIPFSAGRRICPGMNLALCIVSLLLATLVHAFDWELPGGQIPQSLNMDEHVGISAQRAVPLLVHPKPRLAPHAYS